MANNSFARLALSDMILATDPIIGPLNISVPTAVVFFMIAGVFLATALHQQYLRSPDKTNFLNPGRFPLVVAALLMLLVAVIVVSSVFPKRTFTSSLSCAHYAERHNDPELAAECYQALALQHPLETDYHFGYVSNHFAQPAEYRDSKGHTRPRTDYPVEEFYEAWLTIPDSRLLDIAHLGLALFNYHKHRYLDAVAHLDSITNPSLKYANYLRGLVAVAWDEPVAQLFIAETKLPDGYKEGAYLELVELYMLVGNNDALVGLSRNPDAVSHLEPYIQRLLYFKANNPGGYLKGLLREFGYRAAPMVVLAILLITAVWFIFLLKLDLFEREQIGSLIAVMLLEVILTLAVFPLSDLYQFRLEHLFTGSPIEGFASYVFRVGLIEEAMKILPLVLLLIFTKKVNEPFDYLLYASISALTFAAVENVIYFSEYGTGIIHGRALTVVVGHMIFTSSCAYVLMFFRYRFKAKWFLGVIPGLLLAAVIHGLWNALTEVYILMLIYFTLLLRVWARLIANALNNSEFFTYGRKLNAASMQQFLVFGLVAILVFEYIYAGIEFDAKYANQSLLTSLITGSFFTAFLVIRLGNIDLAKGYWGLIDLSPGLIHDITAPHNLVGSEVEFQPYETNPYLIRILADFPQGIIINRVTVGSRDAAWYLVKMFEPLMLKDCVRDHLLVKFVSQNPHLGTDFNMIVNVLVMNREEDLVKQKIPVSEVIEFGWAFLSLREPGKPSAPIMDAPHPTAKSDD